MTLNVAFSSHKSCLSRCDSRRALTQPRLSMSCAATIRLSLRWLPEEAYEDTDTLVLSVSNHFLDIRVKKDRSKIDWAFAGTKRIEADGRNVWTHSIDSRGWTDEDAGYVTALDHRDELEEGSMKNPDRGDAMMQHEEVWRCLELNRKIGYIAMRNDEKAWVAFVDDHFLELVHDTYGFSVARYAKSKDEVWSQVLTMGPTRIIDNVSDTTIMDLVNEQNWKILASTGGLDHA